MDVQRYQASCRCGKTTVIVDKNCAFLQIFCERCRTKSLQLGEQSPSSHHTHQNSSGLYVIDHYRIFQRLGEGATGQVFLAIDEEDQQKVALKLMHKMDEVTRLRYFQREIEVLTRLSHPNIVSLKGWGDYKGSPYLATEYIPGSTLLAFLTKGPLPPRQAAKVIRFVLDALEYAHQHKVIHRDIKPANIFISHEGVVKLLDLGIAKVIEDSLGNTETGEILGSTNYIAPEQLHDAKHVDYRADIYSVGATLFEMLCGIPPYSEYGGNMRKMFWGKVNCAYIPLRERAPGVPAVFANIVEKAMAHAKEERYSSAGEMKQEIIDFYKGQTS